MSENPTYRGDERPRTAQGVPGARAAGVDAPDTARDMVRKVMQEGERPVRHKRLPTLAPAEPAPAPSPAGAAAPMHNAAQRRRLMPRRKHVWLLALALVMVWKPLLLPLIVLVTFWIGLICYLTLGHERSAAGAARIWSGYERRWPARAARARRRADGFALWWHRVLDRLPERWAARRPDHLGHLCADLLNELERIGACHGRCSSLV